MMFRRHQTRMHHHAALFQLVIVITFPKISPANFRYKQAASSTSVFRQIPFQNDIPPHQALRLDLSHLEGAVIEAEDRYFSVYEIGFEGQELAAVAQGVPGHQ